MDTEELASLKDATSQRIELLKQWLPTAEAIALRYFRTSQIGTENKDVQAFDPVTRADKEIELSFHQWVGENWGDDGVTGEEFVPKPSETGFEWVIDPIDGTRAFVIGAPSFTTLVALRYDDATVASVIVQPFTGERFFSSQGEATYHGGETEIGIRTNQSVKFSDAILASTFPEIGTDAERTAFERVSREARMVRYGLDGYAYALLAMGHIDLVIEAGLKPFDYRAPEALVTAAGGCFSDWQGDPPSGVSTIIAAANETVWKAALELLNQTNS